jgi:transcriptional regulator with XRE-family HTH domain
MQLQGKDIASILGVSPVSVSRWEKENAKIGASNDRLIRMLYIQSVEESNKKVFCGILNGLAAIKQSAKPSKISIGQKELSKPISAIEGLFACA